MVDQQYDVSSKMRELFEKKQKQRTAAKEYFQKFLYNPHRPMNDGYPFDPALQRFNAMSIYHIENFNPSARHWGRFIVYLSPIVILYNCLMYSKTKKEELLRSGKVSYHDRSYKLIF